MANSRKQLGPLFEETIFPLFLPSSKRPLNAWSDVYVHYVYYATSKELFNSENTELNMIIATY